MKFPSDHNQTTLGERCHNKLVKAAETRVAALKARKLAERIFDRVYLATEAKTVGEREAKARTDERFITIEDAAIEAESAAIISKSESDGLQIEFEQWRSRVATERAEMTLR